jgi:hypothetical protein
MSFDSPLPHAPDPPRRAGLRLRTLLIAIAVFAVWLAVLQQTSSAVVAAAFLFGPLLLVLAVSTFRAVRGRAGVARRVFVTLLVVVCVVVAVVDVQGPRFDLPLVFCFMGVCILTPVLLALGLAMAVPGRNQAYRWRAWLALPLAGLPLVLLLSNAPFHVGFLVSRPALERMAEQVRAGRAIALPARAGLYPIRGVARSASNQTVGLLLTTRGNRAGFVWHDRSAGAAPDQGPLMGVGIHLTLPGGWSFQEED